jgi:hypothetical protein
MPAGTGLSTRYPSTTPHGLALGPDLPWADQPAPGTLGHPARGFLTLETLLMPAFSPAPPPPRLTPKLQRWHGAPLPTPTPEPHTPTPPSHPPDPATQKEGSRRTPHTDPAEQTTTRRSRHKGLEHTPHPTKRHGMSWKCRGFGGVLKPRYIVGAESLDQ